LNFSAENFISPSNTASERLKIGKNEEVKPVEKMGEGVWVSEERYESAIFNLKINSVAKDFFIHEGAGPDSLGAIRLKWLSCEREGSIDFYVNDEFQGTAIITSEVVEGKVTASCCEFRIIFPKEINSVTVVSEDFEGSFKYIYLRLK
jgi:hypothetical protein